MSPHNKRTMAQKKANKERQAGFHARRSHKSSGGYGNGSNSKNKYGKHTHKTNPRHIYDNADPLDCQLFDYIIVVDVEATCEDNNKNYPHEIIELPGILIDVRRGIVDTKRSFRSYVKPWRNPVLTEFCKNLTGITQAQVDEAPSLSEVVKNFEQWFRATIPKGSKVVFAADGPWDFKNFIHEHSILRDHVSFPTIFYEYIDIRTTFARHFNGGAAIKLDAMLRRMKLRFEGRPHCGFDDAKNIARLAVAMMRNGCVFDFLLAIPMDDNFNYTIDGYPLYRREEGSGKLDADVVDDIAKLCFGVEYFRFGEEHRQAVLAYREKHPSGFKGMMLREQDAFMQRNQMSLFWRCLAVGVLAIVAVLMMGVLTWSKITKWRDQ